MQKWNYKHSGLSMAYGPLFGPTEKAIKDQYKKENNIKRLPKGFECWKVQ
jgi:hypothetical protein